MDTDTTIILRKCSGCHTTKIINHFDINNKGVHFKTCNNCRLRNKIKRTKQPKEESTFNKQIDNSIYENLILNIKTKTLFLNKILEYTDTLCVVVEIINWYDIINDNEIFKLIFKASGSMIIINYRDTLKHVKRLIYEELRNDKSLECTLCLNDYLENDILTARTKCGRCYNDYCIKCFYTLYDKKEGLIICPFCRNISGCPLSAHDYSRGKKFKFKQQYFIANNKHEHILFNFSKS
jgi:hypothetical protein